MYPTWTQVDIHSPSAPFTASLRRPANSQDCPVKHMPTSHPHTSQHSLLLLYEASRCFLPLKGPSRENHASVKHLPRPRRLSRLEVNRPFDSSVEGCCCGSMRQGESQLQIMSDTDDRLGSGRKPCVSSFSSDHHESRLTSFRRPSLAMAPKGNSQTPLRLGPRRISLRVPCVVFSVRFLLMSFALCLLLAGGSEGSEFPDRECCDSVPPPPPNYHQATSTTTTTTPTPHAGHNTSTLSVSNGANGVINCIEARQQCHNDHSCRDVLTMLHKICGPELVACATVTPGKCKLLLKTLGTFDYLTSCSCAEPHIDFNCYTFRETIFNHPCSLVDTPEDNTAVMPTCSEANDLCKTKGSCLRNYMDFVNMCSFSGITCTAQDSTKCNEIWRKIRLSPLFGCTCAPPPPMRTLAYGGRGGPGNVLTSMRGSGDDNEDCIFHYNKTHENPCLVGQKDLSKAVQVETAQAMCHVALDECHNDEDCLPLLNGVMLWCEHAHCEPDRCRTALQEFYQRVSILRRLQVAFCVCRQSDPDGECLTAMRKLHPTCAERHAGRDPMKCHKIAEQCRQNRVCSKKLREYEQKCAADAMTGRCSDKSENCQQAVMNILGTELHATCVCKGTDFLHHHDCYTWQKLLWSNPCVIESHLELHDRINNGEIETLEKLFREMTTETEATPDPYPQYIPPTSGDMDYRKPPDSYGSLRYNQETDQGPRPSETYAIDRSLWRHGGRIRPAYDRNGEPPLPTGQLGSHNRGGYQIDGTKTLRYPTEDKDEIPEKGWPTHNGVKNRNTGIIIGQHRSGLGSTIGRDPNRGVSILGKDRSNVFQINVDQGEPGADPRNRNRPTDIIGSPGRNGINIYNPNGKIHGSRPRGEPGHRGTPIDIGEREGEIVPSRETGRHIENNRPRPRLNKPHGKWIIGVDPNRLSPDEEREARTRSPPYHPEVPQPSYITPPFYVAVTSPPPPMPAGVPTAATNITAVFATTVPRRSCSMKIGDMTTLSIPEGGYKRHYKDTDCSELCHCILTDEDREPQAKCTTLTCMDTKACNTSRALYPHTAPYYLAYRGLCVCYNGAFICQRPNPEYDLGPGIYLFLGYSRGEVKILQPHTSVNEHEAVKILETILIKDYGFKCTLETKHHMGENFIILAELSINPETYISPFIKQRREKEECAGPLRDLAEKINARPRHPDIITDSILSMFILAAVDVNIPEAQTSPAAAPASVHLDLLALLAGLSAHLLLTHWALLSSVKATGPMLVSTTATGALLASTRTT
ncbi:uncharacterized protein [Procambarus clarkii]|uniref:uncharacterized protein isoform X2 n=1 Tax=Procambarus clarkii TaxID=6728 RepID=UPI0037442D59